MTSRYQSEILQAIHEDMLGMRELGIISDAEMREFDEDCLAHEDKPAYAAEQPIAESVQRAAF